MRVADIKRKRLAAIYRGAPTTTPEAEALFDALEINRFQAFLAVDQLGDPQAYFTPVVETVALFSGEFVQALKRVVEDSGTELETVRQPILSGLAQNLAERVVQHQQMIDAKRDEPIA